MLLEALRWGASRHLQGGTAGFAANPVLPVGSRGRVGGAVIHSTWPPSAETASQQIPTGFRGSGPHSLVLYELVSLSPPN